MIVVVGGGGVEVDGVDGHRLVAHHRVDGLAGVVVVLKVSKLAFVSKTGYRVSDLLVVWLT